MAEWLQQLDPSKLVLAETVLSFAISPFKSPSYNLPIFLFGIYAQEIPEGVQSLQIFTGLMGVSAIFDIIYMARHGQSWFTRMITIFILILKLPTFFALALALRQRGAQFSGLGIRGGDLTGPTVWSMPGGFTSGGGREGYQTVDEESHTQAPRAPVSQSRPPPQGPPAPTPAAYLPATGAYQSV